MARFLVRTLADLGDGLAFAPERHLAASMRGEGTPLSSLVVERVEHVPVRQLAGAVVLDTSHVKDGTLDVAAARAAGPSASPKKRVHEGDLLVSRLRPYLRQLALVHPAVVRACAGAPLVCSTEFYVLAPKSGAELAFLLPFLLSEGAQAALAAGQEGGHHPRVPRETLLALRVPRAAVAARAATSQRVSTALAAHYVARARLAAVLGE